MIPIFNLIFILDWRDFMTYIADEIKEDYTTWRQGMCVYMTATTGTGKTTFILKTLYKYAVDNKLPMLYLVNRKILKKQILEELLDIQNKLENSDSIGNATRYIKVMTYQELEEKLLVDNTMYSYYDNYFYIVADECHYFLNDSAFNPKTGLSYDFLIRANGQCRIFISATMDRFRRYTQERINQYSQWKPLYGGVVYPGIKEYTSKPDYSYINFDYFYDEEEIVDAVKESKKEKWLIFIDNKEKGKDLKKVLDEEEIESVFIDAEYNSERTEREVERIVRYKQSISQVLIATSVLNNGISLVDEKLKNIVICADIKEEFLQMLGRKRCKKDEKVNLFVKKRRKQDFLQRKNTYVLEKIYFLNDLEWQNEITCDVMLQKALADDKYCKCMRNLCYVKKGEVVFNRLSVMQFRYLYAYYSQIIERFNMEGDNAFLYQQAEWLGIEDIEEKIKKLDVQRYDKYHQKFSKITEDYIKTRNKADDGSALLNQTERNEYREKVRRLIIKMLPIKVSMNDDEWENMIIELGKKNRPFSADSFNKLMDTLNFDYEMEKLKKRGKEEKYALRHKVKK